MNTEIKFNQVEIEDKFWSPRLEKWRKVLVDTCLDKCREYGQIDNFKKAAGTLSGNHVGMYFNDADVYKVIEGISYFFMSKKDEALEEKIDEIILAISGAQEKDGYLNTYFTLEDPDGKWTDMEKHEMFSVGQLIEAGIAYYQATSKKALLNVAIKAMDNLIETFGPGKRSWVAGHEEIEIAVIKLYEFTKDRKYIEFAKWIIQQRGHGHGSGEIWDKTEWGPAYCQDDVPAESIHEAVGHAVRALYLYSAMAQYTRVTGDNTFEQAIKKVWQDIVSTKMYVTGGVGSSRENEGFKQAYFLPNISAYSETCAAIANVFFNHQLSLLSTDSSYQEVIERCLYNGVLSGISLSANKFFYVNPLESIGNHHRSEWFDVSCCPTNLIRFLPTIAKYIYQVNSDELIINQYIGNRFKCDGANIHLESNLSQSGNVTVTIQNEEFHYVKLRIPSWTSQWAIKVNGISRADLMIESGYVSIPISRGMAVITLAMGQELIPIKCSEKVVVNRGKVAIMKGPFIYCAEEVDNHHLNFDELSFSSKAAWHSVKNVDLDCEAIQIDRQVSLYLVPYFAWDNRDAGYMKVWLDEEQLCDLYSV